MSSVRRPLAHLVVATLAVAAAVTLAPGQAGASPGRVFHAARTGPSTVSPAPCPQPIDVTACQTVTRGIRRVLAPESSAASGDGTGRVVGNVAVLDSGIDASHPDLNVVGGTNCFADGVPVGTDPNGHGTAVAGVIGAKDNRSFVVGVAPGVRLWSVRVLDANLEADDAQILCGLDWVIATRTDRDPRNDIDVVNMSLTGPGADDGACGRIDGDLVHQRICRAVALGVTVVAGAGNDGTDLAGSVPAAYDEVLTATAIADGDGLPGALTPDPCLGAPDDAAASFSNYASAADAGHVVAAPGVCISSLYPGNDVTTDSGTSYSTPFVTGTVVLCLASGDCAGKRPAAIVRTIVNDAARYSARKPAYGFVGDLQHPVAGRVYGPLVRASAY